MGKRRQKQRNDIVNQWKSQAIGSNMMVMNDPVPAEEYKIPPDAFNPNKIKDYKVFLRDRWPKYKDVYKSIWEQMNLENRADFLRAISPLTPNSPTDHVIDVGTRKEDVKFSCQLTPEVTLSELIPGEKLWEIIEYRTFPEDEELLNRFDYEFVKRIAVEVLYDDCKTECEVQKYKHLLFERLEEEYVFLHPLEKWGQKEYVRGPVPPSIQKLFDREQIVNLTLFELILTRLNGIYGTLSGVIEEFDHAVIDKEEHNKLFKPTACSMCKRKHKRREPDAPLSLCECGLAAYCSKECQKRDWSVHKQSHTEKKKSYELPPNAAHYMKEHNIEGDPTEDRNMAREIVEGARKLCLRP